MLTWNDDGPTTEWEVQVSRATNFPADQNSTYTSIQHHIRTYRLVSAGVLSMHAYTRCVSLRKVNVAWSTGSGASCHGRGSQQSRQWQNTWRPGQAPSTPAVGAAAAVLRERAAKPMWRGAESLPCLGFGANQMLCQI